MKNIKSVGILFLLFGIYVLSVAGNYCREDERRVSAKESADCLSSEAYRLVWQDTFDRNVLDTICFWNIEENGNGGGNMELQYYRKENVSLGTEPETGSRCLILTARKESFNGKNFTSGRLNTKDKVSVKYGKIEARIKLPKTANGLWPAFWLLGSDVSLASWPGCGEIDVLEMGHADGILKGVQERFFNGACHWGSSTQEGQVHSYAQMKTNDYGMQDGFHLYTLIWEPEEIRMYLDMDKYPQADPYYILRLDDPEHNKNAAPYFRKPYFILFNLAVGGNFPQIWNFDQITALQSGEARMYVDYVKIYQKESTGTVYTKSDLLGSKDK